MIRFAIATDVDRPVEDVFAFVTDPSRLQEWQTNTVSVTNETGGEVREGTRLREVHRAPGGRDLESLVEVSAFEPARRFDLKILEGPLPIDGRHTFTPREGGGTRVDFVAEGQPSGAMRLLQPVLRRQLEKQFRASFARLKQRLED